MEEEGEPSPLSEAPKLDAWESAVWGAYNWLLTYADGMGGFRPDSLDIFFTGQNPGAGLEPDARTVIRTLIPHLIGEDRRLERKKRDEEMKRLRSKHSRR